MILTHWPSIHRLPTHKPPEDAEQHDKPKYDAGIVHVLGRHRLVGWKEEENYNECAVSDGKNVQRQAKHTQSERAIAQQRTSNPPNRVQEHGDEV